MIRILYQDRDMIVCIKPAGILAQDGDSRSLPQELMKQLQLNQIYTVHRLDREVGGVMVYAQTQKAAASLSQSIQKKTLEKQYLAVLRGSPTETEARLEDLLFHDRTRNKTYVADRLRKGVKDAALDYQVLERAEGRTLVSVQLHTGRTHQIRVQFASRKLPLVGDGKYGGKAPGCALGLWSWKLSFPHPATGKTMSFSCLPPEELPWTSFPSYVNREVPV